MQKLFFLDFEGFFLQDFGFLRGFFQDFWDFFSTFLKTYLSKIFSSCLSLRLAKFLNFPNLKDTFPKQFLRAYIMTKEVKDPYVSLCSTTCKRRNFNHLRQNGKITLTSDRISGVNGES